jgi:hypothetical protein
VPGLLQSQSGQPVRRMVTIQEEINQQTNNPLYIVDGMQINSADFAG